MAAPPSARTCLDDAGGGSFPRGSSRPRGATRRPPRLWTDWPLTLGAGSLGETKIASARIVAGRAKNEGGLFPGSSPADPVWGYEIRAILGLVFRKAAENLKADRGIRPASSPPPYASGGDSRFAASENSTGRSKGGFASARCCPMMALPLAVAAPLNPYRIAPLLAVIPITRRKVYRAPISSRRRRSRHHFPSDRQAGRDPLPCRRPAELEISP